MWGLPGNECLAEDPMWEVWNSLIQKFFSSFNGDWGNLETWTSRWASKEITAEKGGIYDEIATIPFSQKEVIERKPVGWEEYGETIEKLKDLRMRKQVLPYMLWLALGKDLDGWHFLGSPYTNHHGKGRV